MFSQDTIDRLAEKLAGMIRHEIQQAYRPADEVIYDDVDLRNMLKVSKRTTAYWREKKLIRYRKEGGKIFYRLSSILAFIKENETPAITENLKIKL